jgi:hypothetical protein
VRVPAHADVVHVIQAVYFGHLSGCPMTAHKISMFIDMPRTSVLRGSRSWPGMGTSDAKEDITT